MNFHEMLVALWARRRIVFLCMALTIAATALVLSFLPRTYKATTSIVVLNYKGSNPVSGSIALGQLAATYMSTYTATQVDIITSPHVARIVAEHLKLAEDPEWRSEYAGKVKGEDSILEWIAARLLENLTVKPSPESNVISITARSRDAHMAARVANKFAAVYQEVTLNLETNPARSASGYLTEQTDFLRNVFVTTQQRVSDFRRLHDLVDVDHSVDVEATRLTELSKELAAVQGESISAMSSQTHAAGGRATSSANVISNPLVQSLKLEISKATAKLEAMAVRLTTDHPLYVQQKAEVDRLRAELNAQMKIITTGLGTNARVLAKREADLQAAVAEQRGRVLEVNRKRDELFLLTKEMENAQRAYQTVAQRLDEAKIQGHAAEADVSVLTQATPPLLPSSPKRKLSLLLSAVTGMLFGLGAALLIEIRDRRVRSPGYLVDVLHLPVLAEIPYLPPRAPPRRLPFRPTALFGKT